MATKHRSIGFFGYIIISCLALCLFSCDGRKGQYPVEITDEQFDEYYRQFQSRYEIWQRDWGIPIYQIPETIQNTFIFYEFQATPGSTCYFDKPNSIQIGNDKWQSGCVPHEIGHAVLYLIGHPCHGEFEHEQEKEKCLKRF